jgi:hypothetical protein
MFTTFIIAAIRKIGRGLKLTVEAYFEASKLSYANRKVHPFSGI